MLDIESRGVAHGIQIIEELNSCPIPNSCLSAQDDNHKLQVTP